MSGVSLPVTRTVGRALLVGSPPCRVQPLTTLQGLGFGCVEADDPYAAMSELSSHPLNYRALILSLSSVYREELPVIRAVKRRFPHVEVWLAETDGRHGLLVEGMSLGADGLLADDGLHRVGVAKRPESNDSTASAAPLRENRERPAAEVAAPSADDATSADVPDNAISDTISDTGPIEPVVTADELRALLQEQSPVPPISEMH